MAEIISDDQIVMKLVDIRELHLCNSGCRTWLIERGMTWKDFVDGKYTAQDFMDTGDGLIVQVVEQARRRINGV